LGPHGTYSECGELARALLKKTDRFDNACEGKMGPMVIDIFGPCGAEQLSRPEIGSEPCSSRNLSWAVGAAVGRLSGGDGRSHSRRTGDRILQELRLEKEEMQNADS
jgi:hypothetical protein